MTIQIGSEEWYDLINIFESIVKSTGFKGSGSLILIKSAESIKNKRITHGGLYDHGQTSAMFDAFLHGYVSAKSIYCE